MIIIKIGQLLLDVFFVSIISGQMGVMEIGSVQKTSLNLQTTYDKSRI